MLLGIGHNKRSDIVPHWLHQATLATLKMPCQHVDIWESHIFDIGNSRQQVAEIFLKIPGLTHILFVDDDIAVGNSDALNIMFKFLEEDKQYIVSGLYYRRQKPHYPLIMACEEKEDIIMFGFPYGETAPENSIIKVGAVPAGFLLVKREVFEKIPKPWFVYGDPELTRKQAKKGAPPGEDIYFSLKARKCGFELFVDTRVDLIHYCPEWVGKKEVINKLLGTPETLDQDIKEINDVVKQREAGVKTEIH